MVRRAVSVLFALVLVVPGLTATASGPPSFSLPDQASEVAPGVFFLGTAVQDGITVVGYAYERSASPDERGRRANGKPEGTPGGGGGNGGNGGNGGEEETDSRSCYSYIAKGAHWNTVEGYVLDGSGGPAGIGTTGTDGAFATWEAAAGVGEIVGSSDTGTGLEADTSSPDETNEIYFDTMSGNTLGYTIVWYTRSRGRNAGQIVAADMVIDPDWNWYTGDADGIGNDTGEQMDFWSVFTHEVGHWVGMGHTDTTTLCREQTMYPSIGYGDSSKRILGDGDKAGVFSLYN